MYGAIEAGGTKFICLVGESPQNIIEEIRIPTTSPSETISQITQFFQKHNQATPLNGIGIGCFGPLNLRESSPDFGKLISTPKLAWEGVNLRKELLKYFNCSISIDTDVNAAAIGEYKWGAGQGLQNIVYLTVGTGIGGGAIVNGRSLRGLMHPEMGHMFIPRSPDDAFEGNCPFHQICLEGLASGSAIDKRIQGKGVSIFDKDLFWELETQYLALGIVNIICILSPERIILGGGVFEKRDFLFPMIRKKVQVLLNSYIQMKEIVEDINQYIVSSDLGSQSGILGALALAYG